MSLKMAYTHVHTQFSNSILLEAPSYFTEYLDEIEKRDDIIGIMFTEHGNNVSWGWKYLEFEKRRNKYLKLAKDNPEDSKKYTELANKMKYIHSIEAYTCDNADDKENYHICLYGLNNEGRKEINRLITQSYKRETNNFYRRPRMFIDDILKCENIAIGSACVGGVLSEPESYSCKKLIEWGIKNKDKLFLEIQSHKLDKQIEINKEAIRLHEAYGLNLITSNDNHYVNIESKRTREILERNRDNFHEDEHECDLSLKSTKTQKTDLMVVGIDEKYAESAINNTVKLWNMCEHYEIDKGFKFPHISENPKKVLFDRCMDRLKELNLLNNYIYTQRVIYELGVIEKLKALDYMVLFSDWITWAKNNNIAVGVSRGSCSGAVVAYLTNITNIDSIMWNTSFDRFMNELRTETMCDIDIDFEPSRRHEAKQWFYNHPKLNCSEILTFTTQAYKGACDIACRVYNSGDNSEKLSKQDINRFKELYGNIRQSEGLSDNKLWKVKAKKTANELIDWMNSKDSRFGEIIRDVVNLEGCITAVGTHPAGVLVSDLDIESEIGLIQIEDKDNKGQYKLVSQLTMKELEKFGYVKADALGLANTQTVNNTCKMIGMDFPNPQTFDFNDEKVWQDISKSPQMIFQFEATKSHEHLQQALSVVSTDKKLQTMSMMSGLIRPSGASTRERFLSGKLGDNGHPEINNAFPNTMSFVTYQEDIISFLNKFCGYNYSQSDVVRRCLHEDTEVYLSNGFRKKIKNISIGDEVISINNDTYKIEHKTVTNKWHNGVKNVKKITTTYEKDVILTDEHKVLTDNGYKKVSELKVGDWLYTNKVNINKHDNLKGNQRIPYEVCYAIGLLIGDGYIKTNDPRFINSEIELVEKYKKCMAKRFRDGKIEDMEYRTGEVEGKTVDKIYRVSIGNEDRRHCIIKFIKELGIYETSEFKKIPEKIKSYGDTKPLHGIIAGLFNTDGYVVTNANAIEYSSKSRQLSHDLQDCLSKIGITSYVHTKYVKGYNYYMHNLRIILSESYKMFEFKILPLMVGKKYDEFKNIIDNNKNVSNLKGFLIPDNHTKELNNAVKNSNLSFRYMFGDMEFKSKYNKTSVKAEKIIEKIYAPNTYKLLRSDLLPIKIKSIKDIKKKANVYDIEVEDNHNFVANGIVVHNCIAKKSSDEDFNNQMKKIDSDFRSYFPKHYNTTQKQMDDVMKSFLTIVKSAQGYAFSYNHAIAYTMLGYFCGYMRYYHELEYVTANLNAFNDKPDKMKEIHFYMQQFMPDVKMSKPKFPVASVEYTCDREKNVIYEGMSGAKSIGKNVEDAFSSLPKDIKFKDIIQVWKYMKDNNISGAGKTEFVNLNKLGFFSELEFGQKRNELAIMLLCNNKERGLGASYKYDPKQKEETGLKKIDKVYAEIQNIPDEDYSDIESALHELEILGHTDLRFNVDNLYYIMSVDKPYSKYICKLFNMKTGDVETIKMRDKEAKLCGGKPPVDNLVQISKFESWIYLPPKEVDGKKVFERTNEKEWLIKEYKIFEI